MKNDSSVFVKISWQIHFFLNAISILGLFKGVEFWISWLLKNNNFCFRQPNQKNNIHLRPRSSDLAVYKQIFIRGDYDMKLPNKAEVIIDLGANIGLFTLIMKTRFPNARIFAVEPDSENYKMLLLNVSEVQDVLTIDAGIWYVDTKLSITDKYDAGKWAMVVEEDKENGEIRAVSIETIMKENELNFIDILKIDIETAEKILFSKNYEKWLPAVGTIIIELHDWLDVGCAYNFFKAISNTYDNYAFGIKGENIIISTQYVPSTDIV